MPTVSKKKTLLFHARRLSSVVVVVVVDTAVTRSDSVLAILMIIHFNSFAQ